MLFSLWLVLVLKFEVMVFGCIFSILMLNGVSFRCRVLFSVCIVVLEV